MGKIRYDKNCTFNLSTHDIVDDARLQLISHVNKVVTQFSLDNRLYNFSDKGFKNYIPKFHSQETIVARNLSAFFCAVSLPSIKSKIDIHGNRTA